MIDARDDAEVEALEDDLSHIYLYSIHAPDPGEWSLTVGSVTTIDSLEVYISENVGHAVELLSSGVDGLGRTTALVAHGHRDTMGVEVQAPLVLYEA